MGYVFLGNALNRVGKFLFPSEWDGSETRTSAPYVFWKVFNGENWRIAASEATKNQEVDIHRLLAARRPEFGRSSTIERGPFGPVVPDFSAEEWNAGIDEAERVNAERQPKLKRKAEAQLFIKSAILREALRYVLLPLKGGRFSEPQDRAWWNVRDHDRLFYWCQMNPKDPTGIGVGGDFFQHIFVDEKGLDELLSPSAQAVTPEVNRAELLERARIGEITPEYAEITARANGLGTLSHTPDPVEYDPRKVALWSYEMTVAWIIWRRDDHVRGYWKEYLENLISWDSGPQLQSIDGKRTLRSGHVLTRGSYSSSGLELAVALHDANRADARYPEGVPRPLVDFSGAAAKLRECLELGDIVALATVPEGKCQFEVEPEEWADIAISLSYPGPVSIRNTSAEVEYETVMFPSERVLALWPPFASPTGKEQKAAASAVGRPLSVSTLTQIIQSAAVFAQENGIPPLTRTESEDLFGAAFSDTPRARIREAYNNDAIKGLFPTRRGPRGSRNPDRDNELEKFRQFIRAADLRK